MRKFWWARNRKTGEYIILCNFTHTLQNGKEYEYWQIFGDNRCYSFDEIIKKNWIILSKLRKPRCRKANIVGSLKGKNV